MIHKSQCTIASRAKVSWKVVNVSVNQTKCRSGKRVYLVILSFPQPCQANSPRNRCSCRNRPCSISWRSGSTDTNNHSTKSPLDHVSRPIIISYLQSTASLKLVYIIRQAWNASFQKNNFIFHSRHNNNISLPDDHLIFSFSLSLIIYL